MVCDLGVGGYLCDLNMQYALFYKILICNSRI